MKNLENRCIWNEMKEIKQYNKKCRKCNGYNDACLNYIPKAKYDKDLKEGKIDKYVIIF